MLSRLSVTTTRRSEMIDITAMVADVVRQSGVVDGIVVVWSPHTTAAITVNEGADPDVRSDMVRFLARLIPENGDFRHFEGNSDAHIKTTLTGPGITLIVNDGVLLLGRWQSLYFCEYDGPRERTVFVKCLKG